MNLSDIKQRPHWSYSSLNQLLNICSLQFYFQRIAKLKPAFTSVNLLLGSAYHRTMEQVYLARRNSTVFTPENVLEFFTASWRGAVKDQEVHFGKLTAEETEEQGRKLTVCALENLPQEEILTISEPFVVPVVFRDEFMELPLVGEFDLTVRKEVRTSVVDWKTSGTRWSAGQADKSLQATIYTYAYNQKFRVIPDVRFDVTVKNKTPVFEQHQTARTPDSWDRMALMVNKAEQIVKHECFYPAETSFFCNDCPFGGACKAWHQEQESEVKGQASEIGSQKIAA